LNASSFLKIYLWPCCTLRTLSSHVSTQIPTTYFQNCWNRSTILNKYPLNREQLYSTIIEEPVDSNVFETVCEETLNSLADFFDELIATESKLEKCDIIYGSGVLTIDLGSYGTYVINRQSPNRQIWLSSPLSGPKRYDYSIKEDCWIYRHDGRTLHSLLNEEISDLLNKDLNISECLHGRL